jgi:hypothetical protein
LSCKRGQEEDENYELELINHEKEFELGMRVTEKKFCFSFSQIISDINNTTRGWGVSDTWAKKRAIEITEIFHLQIFA